MAKARNEEIMAKRREINRKNIWREIFEKHMIAEEEAKHEMKSVISVWSYREKKIMKRTEII